jgi:hypothetical protein
MHHKMAHVNGKVPKRILLAHTQKSFQNLYRILKISAKTGVRIKVQEAEGYHRSGVEERSMKTFVFASPDETGTIQHLRVGLRRKGRSET